MNEIKKLLGKNIKLLREKNKMTQEELAEKIEINSRSLSLVECGTNFITAETLNKICLALKISPKVLFDFNEDYIPDENIKAKLFDLINKNEDKLFSIYRIIRGYLD